MSNDHQLQQDVRGELTWEPRAPLPAAPGAGTVQNNITIA
jgi:hypothetical protein